MSDDTFTMADLAPMMKQMQLAKALQGGSGTQMMGAQPMLPAGGGGADMTTPYAGAANAGASFNQMLGQKLLGDKIDNAGWEARNPGIPLQANVTGAQDPRFAQPGLLGRLLGGSNG